MTEPKKKPATERLAQETLQFNRLFGFLMCLGLLYVAGGCAGCWPT